MPSLSMLKWGGALIGALLLVLLALHVKSRMDLANDLVQATRDAVENPDLPEGQVAMQIAALGGDRAELIRLQDSIRAESERTGSARKIAVEASNRAAERGKGYSSAATNLDASAARPAPPDCDASETAKELWR